jgi:DNA-binding transcriptional MerR regulator
VPKIDIQELTKLYYTIGEVAKLLNVNTSLLRFWEKEFQLEVSKKNNKGNRLYSVKEIETINQIYQLVKLEGYTLDGAQKKIRRTKNTSYLVSDKIVLNSSTQSIDNEKLENLISSLQLIKTKLISLKD